MAAHEIVAAGGSNLQLCRSYSRGLVDHFLWPFGGQTVNV